MEQEVPRVHKEGAMVTEALLTAVTEAVFGYLLEESGLAGKMRRLREDPPRRTFREALKSAYIKFEKRHPEWTNALFDTHFLENKGAPVLARLLTRGYRPSPDELVTAWADQLGSESRANERSASARVVASDFLALLDTELSSHSIFQDLFDSLSIDNTAKNTADIFQLLLEEFRGGNRPILSYSYKFVPVEEHLDHRKSGLFTYVAVVVENTGKAIAENVITEIVIKDGEKILVDTSGEGLNRGLVGTINPGQSVGFDILRLLECSPSFSFDWQLRGSYALLDREFEVIAHSTYTDTDGIRKFDAKEYTLCFLWDTYKGGIQARYIRSSVGHRLNT